MSAPDQTPSTLLDAVRNACTIVGIGPLPNLPVIGHVRCPGIGKKAPNRSCWINIKVDCAHIVDHSSGFKTSVFEIGELRPSDRAEFRRKREAAAKTNRAKQKAAIKGAVGAWDSAEPCTTTAYTDRKNINAPGCRWYSAQNCLLVPLRNVNGAIRSLQRIYDDGKKLCWPGAPTQSAFFLIGTIQSEVLITEGMATGSTVYKHTGKPVACAMFAGNLLAVAEAIRNHYPDLEITICGDDDKHSEHNVGRKKAIEAATAVAGKYCFPTFCDDCTTCSDFNDAAACNKRQGVTL